VIEKVDLNIKDPRPDNGGNRPASASLKEMILGALEAVGGEEYLRKVGRGELSQALRRGAEHSDQRRRPSRKPEQGNRI
jgi:hypothetical protein